MLGVETYDYPEAPWAASDIGPYGIRYSNQNAINLLTKLKPITAKSQYTSKISNIISNFIYLDDCSVGAAPEVRMRVTTDDGLFLDLIESQVTHTGTIGNNINEIMESCFYFEKQELSEEDIELIKTMICDDMGNNLTDEYFIDVKISTALYDGDTYTLKPENNINDPLKVEAYLVNYNPKIETEYDSFTLTEQNANGNPFMALDVGYMGPGPFFTEDNPAYWTLYHKGQSVLASVPTKFVFSAYIDGTFIGDIAECNIKFLVDPA